MVHRGPDDEGIHVDPEGVVLGARRLSVIDPERGHQPIANEDGTVWAVLNGEIYNHRRLRDRLAGSGHRLATRCDTEVLVHLWEDFGPELVHAVEGMYAFALWDSRRQMLMLARDRFGEKPLFIRIASGELLFASELTALIAGMGSARPEPSALAVDELFTLGYVRASGSIVEGVEQLQPGHFLLWDASSRTHTVQPYWRPPFPRDVPAKDEEVLAQTEVLLRESVRSRLIADVGVGLLLSGGTDSSLITALAAQEHRGVVKTFTVGYEVGRVSETTEARAVARRLGTEHHEVILDARQVVAEVPALLAGLDQPQADQAFVAASAVSAVARRQVVVALGGEGADELFGGYPRYRWQRLSERLQGLPERPRLLAADALEHVAPQRRLGRMLASGTLLDRHLEWVTGGRWGARPELYGDRMTSVLEGRDLRARLGDHLPSHGDVSDRLMTLDRLHYLPGDVLAKSDRAGMMHSLEVRTPFLHRELAEFVCALPSAVHVRGKGKWILRRLLERVLPGHAGRPKVAFQVPSAEWLRGPLASTLDDVVSAQVGTEGWFDAQALRRLVLDHRNGTDNSAVLWPVLAFGLWLESYRGAG